MGSREIWDLQYRQAFAFIGIFGEDKVTEKRGCQVEEQVSINQLFETSVKPVEQTLPYQYAVN